LNSCDHLKSDSVAKDEFTYLPYKEKQIRYNNSWNELPVSEHITDEMIANARFAFRFDESSQKLIRTVIMAGRTYNTNIPYVMV